MTMFESYSKSSTLARDRRGLLTSSVAAFAIYGLLGLLVLALAKKTAEVVASPAVDVIFAPPAPAAPEPPKPAAPPPPKPSRPKRAAAPKPPEPVPTPEPVVTPEPATPMEMPTAPAPEMDPALVQPAAGPSDGAVGLVDPNSTGAVGGQVGGTGEGPINLPAGGIAPRPSRNNRIPEMPRSARAEGIQGIVVLRIVVTKEGRVTQVTGLQGHPLLLEAAIEAVRTWRYEPATVAGRKVAVFRTIKIPFRLTN